MEGARGTITLVFVVGYALVCIAVGIWAMRRTHSARDFFVAGRNLGVVVSSVAIFSMSTVAVTVTVTPARSRAVASTWATTVSGATTATVGVTTGESALLVKTCSGVPRSLTL